MTRIRQLLRNVIVLDLLLLLVGIGWGYTFVVAKFLIVAFPVLLFLGTRFLIAGFALGAAIWPRMKGHFTRHELKHGAIAGIFLAAAYSLQTFGLLRTAPGLTAMLTELTTVMTPFAYFITSRQPIAKAAIVGTLMAFSGAALMQWNGHQFSPGIGDLLVLLCDVAFVAHLLYVDRFVEKLHTWWFIVVQFVVVGVICLALGWGRESFPHHLTSFQWFAYAFELLFGTLLAYLVQIFAQRVTDPTHVVVVMSVEGPFAMFFSWLQWGERITWLKGVGAIIVFGAVLVTELWDRKGKPASTPVLASDPPPAQEPL